MTAEAWGTMLLFKNQLFLYNVSAIGRKCIFIFNFIVTIIIVVADPDSYEFLLLLLDVSFVQNVRSDCKKLPFYAIAAHIYTLIKSSILLPVKNTEIWFFLLISESSEPVSCRY